MIPVVRAPRHSGAAALRPLASRTTIVAAAVIAAGCAQMGCPSFRAAWYLDRPEASAPTIYLALLNEGNQPLALERVELNPTGPGGRGQEVYKGTGATPALLQPGRLLLVNLEGKLDTCVLPVAVQVQCGGGRSRTQAVSGLLPNYLHEQWIGSCGQVDPAAFSARPQ